MIADALLEFSIDQAISAAGTTVSTNILNFGAAEDLGVTERPLQVWVDWNTVPVGSAPGTTAVQVSLQTSLTGTGGWTTIATGPSVLTTGITGGTTSPIDLPQGCQQYTQLVYNVTGGSLTAGSVTAGLNLDADGGQRYYKRGYTA